MHAICVFAEEYKEYPLILLCDRDNMHRTWYISNQIWPFHNIFYTDYEHIVADNPNLEKYTLVRHDEFYYVYLLE